MYLGILIGMFMFGLLILWGNMDSNKTPAVICRMVAFFHIFVGLCGSIGWIIEVIR